jgi:hypothetical protein
MSNVIELKVTSDQLKRAESLYDFGVLKDSITSGKSNIYGALGEVVVDDWLNSNGRSSKIIGDVNFDLLVDGVKVDVKSKKTSVPPLQNFNCSIAGHNVTQKCDFYIFARVHENKKEAWICGWITKDEFFKKAKFRRKGQPDPVLPAWKFTADCYNLEISKLKQL